MSNPLFWKTIRIYALWGFLWAALVQWLGIVMIFYAGTLIDRPDLSFLQKVLGVFSGALYGAVVFTLPALGSALNALPFVLLAGVIVALSNRGNNRTSYWAPFLAGIVLGAAFAAASQFFGLASFSKIPYFWIADIASVAVASVLCWRRLRKKYPAVLQ